jgi:type I restriction enzyme M protein
VPVGEIRENNYDLSISRYRELTYEATAHEPPTEILAHLRAIEVEVAEGLDELQRLLR